MRCRLCNENKLSEEFAWKTVSPNCNHPPLYCLKCVTNMAENSKQCPFKDCKCTIDDTRMDEFKLLLTYLFPSIPDSLPMVLEHADSSNQVFISNMEGDRTPIELQEGMSVVDLKEAIQRKLTVKIGKQRLLFGDKELEVYTEEGEVRTLHGYGIENGATIHLLILKYAIPEYLDHVIFDVSWEYPSTGRDFLDATCFLFSNNSHKATVNYNSGAWPPGVEAVKHSGDGVNDSLRKGYHTIDVLLKTVPLAVNCLVFTLSVWSNPSIHHFPNPILRFFDATDKTKDLCNTSLSSDTDSEAIIISFVRRRPHNKGWEMFDSGQLSSGNANNYGPLLKSVQGVITGKLPGMSSRARIGLGKISGMSSTQAGAHRSGPRPVNVAFSFDTTGSMSKCLDEVRQKLNTVIRDLLSDIPYLSVAVIAHGDYDCPDPYVINYKDFTNNFQELSKFVKDVKRTKGGDEECYEYALHIARTQLSWTKGANKSLVLIGDSTPHEKNYRLNKMNIDWKEEANKLYREQGIRIHAVRCITRWPKAESFWKELAVIGHGKYQELQNFKDVVRLMQAICYREADPEKFKRMQAKEREKGIKAFFT